MALALLKKNLQMKGGEVISRMLAAENVDTVFGIIDGTYFGLYSTFETHGIRLISPRHETCAAHMAGAYARTTGKLGVCMASNGPGVANILPGVAVENAEGNRVLLLTSCRREGIVYPDRGGAYQSFPQVEVTRPMTKWSCAVPSVDRLAEIVRRAMRVAFTGRPGIVHVDVPESVLNGKVETDPSWFRAPDRYRPMEPLTPGPGQIEEAATLLTEARTPVIHAGSGVIHAGAFEELREVAELLEAPITTSWAARSVVDERMRQAVPMIFLDSVNQARREADVVLTLGSRIGETDWWGKPPYWGDAKTQRMIQVDIDTDFLGNIKAVDLAVQADVKAFLQALIPALQERRSQMDLDHRMLRIDRIRKGMAARRSKLDKHLEDLSRPMNSAHVPAECRSLFSEEDIVVADGGNSAVWTNFFHVVHTPNTLLGTAKMGMLGAGTAQALGAQAAHPDRRVYCITGDGAMGMHMQEIETAVRANLPVIFIVLCDRQWGMVKINQHFALKPVKTLMRKSLSPEESINTDFCETRFDDLARAMGAHGERVDDPKKFAEAVERSKATGICSVIHVEVDPVKHMWAPALKDFKDMHQEPRG
ncbi:MAG: thiamine pyrophosphate-binding protein [Planctomycetota bacterium]|jgi:acetolactate synthase-1/2/3 large subunit|nr:thiamine pyrophosphate-binding protein [Planctomycetota bacterium]